MLVGISGSQGCGKSTIIANLLDHGALAITRKTSRSILTDWNVSLDEINATPELTIRFQEEIIRRKFQDEIAAANDTTRVWYTERTYADLFTYALVALGNDNAYSDWLDSYYIQCMRFQQTFDKVFYLTAGHFNVVNDGVRGFNRHYSRMVDVVMNDVTTKLTNPQNLTIINTPSLHERLELIQLQTVSTFDRAALLKTLSE